MFYSLFTKPVRRATGGKSKAGLDYFVVVDLRLRAAAEKTPAPRRRLKNAQSSSSLTLSRFF